MNNVIVFKIGGSVVTHKDADTVILREALIKDIAKEIRLFIKAHPQTSLLLVHGAGSAGHRESKRYGLSAGVYDDKKKQEGVFVCRDLVHEVHRRFCDIFLKEQIPVVSFPTHTVITQRDGKIETVHTKTIQHALDQKQIPVLFGSIVFDELQAMSICSGDAITSALAVRLGAKKIVFASDINGIYTKDPHKYTDAKLIKHISIDDIFLDTNIILEESHNVDVTGGILGKVSSFQHIFKNSSVEKVVLFNGLKKEQYIPALSGVLSECTQIVS
jgi:isopentenyl phosphate kinase